MERLELTGTLEERVHRLFEFALAHRRGEADIEYISGIYEAAGVPFTQAAREFIAKYYGLFEGCEVYRRKGNDPQGDPEKAELEVSFAGDIIPGFEGNVRELAELWEGDPEETEYPDPGAQARSLNAVPVGIIGDYYGACVYIADDGKILAFHDYEKMKMHVFGSFEEFWVYEFGNCTSMPAVICAGE